MELEQKFSSKESRYMRVLLSAGKSWAKKLLYHLLHMLQHITLD